MEKEWRMWWGEKSEMWKYVVNELVCRLGLGENLIRCVHCVGNSDIVRLSLIHTNYIQDNNFAWVSYNHLCMDSNSSHYLELIKRSGT